MIINIIKAIILIIATILIIIIINNREKRVIFLVKKDIALINIQTISNKKQKNFENKTKIFVKIRVKTINFWLIIKKI